MEPKLSAAKPLQLKQWKNIVVFFIQIVQFINPLLPVANVLFDQC